jgi:hypothetical protein
MKTCDTCKFRCQYDSSVEEGAKYPEGECPMHRGK